MLAVFVVYLIVVIYKSKFEIKGTADYLAIENTNCVKGIFILMVFLSHFNGYIDLAGKFDGIYQKIIGIIGQAMVIMFMFYSGYGIMESIKKKGDSYISGIPIKRILVTLFRFDCAIILYFILGLITSRTMTVKNVLLSLIGWDSIGNSNWYIFVILLLYLLTYISFKICKVKNLLLSAFLTSALTLAIIGITVVFDIKPAYWYDTALCFAIGLFYSLWKDYIVKIINHNIVTWIGVVLVSFAIFYVSRMLGGVFHLLANFCFTVGFVSLTMRVTFNNKILKWCGEHLFEIYILQRIPMIIFKTFTSIPSNIYVYFILCAMITVVLTFGFKYITDLIWSKITVRKYK